MEVSCYLNGKILPVAEAKVGVYDIGLLRGFGIYEALTTYNRVPFMLADHLQRFRNSARGLAISVPATDKEIAAAISELLERNVGEGKEGIIRFVLTGGRAIEGIEYDANAPTFYILVEELKLLPPETFTKGCSLVMFDDHQRHLPEYKTINYIQAVLLQGERKRAGALEILYHADGKVLECSTSNFFIVSAKGGSASGGKDNKIITPKDNILLGITRKVVIDLARPHLGVEERDVSLDEMFGADEAFLTSSFKEVVPVVKVGEHTIGSGKVGSVTKKVMALFHDFTKSYGVASSARATPAAHAVR